MARTMARVAAGTGFVIEDMRILECTPAWSAPEEVPGFRLVFVRRGLFRLRLPRWDGLVDPLVAYVQPRGSEQRIAHRPGREDSCTVLTLDDELAGTLLPATLPAVPLATSGRTDLARRALLAGARRGADDFELTERVLRLADQLVGLPAADPAPAVSPSHRRLAERARERLATHPALPGFAELAAELGVSRPHLSRVFHAVTGQSLTRCRTQLRVHAALDQLEAGQTDLAALAGDLGFSDHAHLTRTLRAELGSPPSRVRAMLAPAPSRSPA